jgi:predicted alpha/beta hydrolase family esterase
LDFVFIDADHKYESVKADIAAWLPKVRPGGHIAGHDYHSDWPGVQKAVDEVLGKGKFVVRGHSWFCGIPHE